MSSIYTDSGIKHGVTFRTVNLRVKLSRAKRNSRLAAFWCNCIRLLALYRKFCPEQKLRFAGFDQKPFYFNPINAHQTLAQSRERFTTMGACLNWQAVPNDVVRTAPNGAPCLAVLFKVSSGERCTRRVRGKILPRDRESTLVQFAEKRELQGEECCGLVEVGSQGCDISC